VEAAEAAKTAETAEVVEKQVVVEESKISFDDYEKFMDQIAKDQKMDSFNQTNPRA